MKYEDLSYRHLCIRRVGRSTTQSVLLVLFTCLMLHQNPFLVSCVNIEPMQEIGSMTLSNRRSFQAAEVPL